MEMDKFSHDKPVSDSIYSDNIRSYLDEYEKNNILYPHQTDVFLKLIDFFDSGETEGYINLPTGTGKTVLFVELAKALIENSAPTDKPKVLVVAPTKDLVHQTLGQRGEKGFGRFAPDLAVGSFFSDTPREQKGNLDSFDVIVTTYRSFDILNSTNEYRPITDEDRALHPNLSQYAKNVPTGRKKIDKFDIIILDEAHHSLSQRNREIIESLAPETIIIGFTATPDANSNNKLSQILPNKIHELSLKEAISLKLLAPVVPIGVSSGIEIRGSNIYDENGEFIDSRISYLAKDPTRNDQIINIAQSLAENKIGTIISTIAGDTAWHARYLASQLQSRGIRSEAVHAEIPAERRQEIYHQFSDGEIDVLTFVGVLGEGWDSPRAKAIINARPTRSSIFARQRLGRTTRPGATAYTIDICDDFDDSNPIINVADVLDCGSATIGEVVGSPEDEEKIINVIQSLDRATGGRLIQKLVGNYKEHELFVSRLEKLNRGQILDDRGQAIFAIPSRINSRYVGLTEEMITQYESLNDITIPKKLAARGKATQMVYDIEATKDMLYSLPDIDPDMYYIDDKQDKWLAPSGVIKLFSKRFSNMYEDEMLDLIDTNSHLLEWVPAKYNRGIRSKKWDKFYITKIFKANQENIDILNNIFNQRVIVNNK